MYRTIDEPELTYASEKGFDYPVYQRGLKVVEIKLRLLDAGLQVSASDCTNYQTFCQQFPLGTTIKFMVGHYQVELGPRLDLYNQVATYDMLVTEVKPSRIPVWLRLFWNYLFGRRKHKPTIA